MDSKRDENLMDEHVRKFLDDVGLCSMEYRVKVVEMEEGFIDAEIGLLVTDGHCSVGLVEFYITTSAETKECGLEEIDAAINRAAVLRTQCGRAVKDLRTIRELVETQ